MESPGRRAGCRRRQTLPRNRRALTARKRSALLWNNHDVRHQPVILASKVVLHPARVRNSPIGVIDHTEERAACGVRLVFRDIYYELLAELLCGQSGPHHLDLYDSL